MRSLSSHSAVSSWFDGTCSKKLVRSVLVVPLTTDAPIRLRISKCWSAPTFLLPWNSMCSNRCANPLLPGTS